MNNALTAIIIAFGGTSLIYILVSQFQNRRTRGRSGGSAGPDGGHYAGGGDSGSQFFSWGDTGHGGSDPSTGADNSGDSGGASDSGGGDGGGGGGDGGGGGSD
jgi:hypothetical protein